jgi:hypothetical protein
LNPAQRIAALETEADRLKSRLDVFAKQLDGDPDLWLSIVEQMPPTVAEVVVDKVLAEARQTALAYTTVVRTLAQLQGTAALTEGKPDPVDQLGTKRQEKLAEAARKAAGQ